MNTDKLLKHSYLVTMYNTLKQSENAVKMQLNQHPGDIQLMSQLDRIKHDQNLIWPKIQELSSQLNDQLERELQGQFKFVIDRSQKNGILKKV